MKVRYWADSDQNLLKAADDIMHQGCDAPPREGVLSAGVWEWCIIVAASALSGR